MLNNNAEGVEYCISTQRYLIYDEKRKQNVKIYQLQYK